MKLPSDFKLGVATAAYQIEGTQFGTCGLSHWDTFAKAGGTPNGEDGRTACAHYELWESDLDLIAQAHFDAYRFSIAWPRIQPAGSGKPKSESLDFYDRLVDGLLERDVEAHATLYHWDLPQKLADKGGWANPDTCRYFADYACHVMERLGDRLSSTATINEPWCVTWLSHFLGHHAPGKQDLNVAGKAMHNVLFAHGLATQALRGEGHSNLGIVLNMEYAEPATDRDEDQRAAQIHDGIYNRWFIEALTKGEYPNDVLEHLHPYLPEDWQSQMPLIAQPIDWLGLNYYTRSLHADDGSDQFPFGKTTPGPLPKTSMGWEIYPDGLGFFLNRLHQDYTGDLPLFVTENGMATHHAGGEDPMIDTTRIAYLEQHLQQVLDCHTAGVPVQGYFAWSLLDNFEWAYGYSERFGIVHVDYDTQKRSPKASYDYLKGLRA